MIFSFLAKLILFYFLFVFIRGMFQTYKAYKLVKERASQGQTGAEDLFNTQRTQRRSTSTGKSDIIEAEFRVLDENN